MSPTSFEQGNPSTSELPNQNSSGIKQVVPIAADEAALTKLQLPSSAVTTAVNRSSAAAVAPQLYWAPTNYITPALSSFGNTTPLMSTYGYTPMKTPIYIPCNCCRNAAVGTPTATVTTVTTPTTVPINAVKNVCNTNITNDYAASVSSTTAESSPTTVTAVNTTTEANKLSSTGCDTQNNEAKKETWSIGFYEVGDVIGQGNYARVRKGYHRFTKIPVAVKCIDKQKMDDALMTRAKREIAILKRLNHPNIATLYQVFETTRGFYLVMQYAANGELASFLPGNRILPEAEARIKLWQIVSAVEYCHSLGIVHRDLKLENLLLDKNFNVKIVDFGFSNIFSTTDTLKTFCGSPPYAAPEIFEGREYIGPEVDIWSMGVILYKLVCGDLPFNAPAYHDLRYRVTRCPFRVPFYLSTDCENLLRKMLHKNPKRRATIAEIKAHPWMMDQTALNTVHMLRRPVPDFSNPNESILTFMEKSLNISREKVEEACKNNARDDVQAWYTLLWEFIYLKDLVKETYRPDTEPNKQTVKDNAIQCNRTATTEPKDSTVTEQSERASLESQNVSDNISAMTTTTATVIMPLKKPQASMATTATAITKTVDEPCKLQKLEHSQQNDCKNTSSLEYAVKQKHRVPPEERVFIRHSTATTITSLDEGFETDAHASSATIYNSKELPAKVTMRAVSLPYESVDGAATTSSEKNEIQSASQPENIKDIPEDQSMLSEETKSNLLENFTKEAESAVNNMEVDCCQGSISNAKKTTVLDIVKEETDSLRLSQEKSGSCQQSSSAERNCANNGEKFSVTDKSAQKQHQQHQRSQLADSLQFQPHQLLNIKQGIHLEQQISGSSDASELTQTHCNRMVKQLQLKNRLNHTRQQTNLKHNGFTQLPPTLPEEPSGNSATDSDDRKAGITDCSFDSCHSSD